MRADIAPLRGKQIGVFAGCPALLFACLSAMMALSCAALKPGGERRPSGKVSSPSPAFAPNNSPPPQATIPPPASAEIAAAEQRVRANGQDADARIALASLYERAGKLPEAVGELRQAIRLAPQTAAAYRPLAELYRQGQYLDREIAVRERLLRLAPRETENALRLADIYLDLNWLGSAEKALARAAKTSPGTPRLLTKQASAALLRGDGPAMERVAQEGLHALPKEPKYYLILADAQRLQGRYAQAEESLRQAIALTADPKERAQGYLQMAYLFLNGRWPSLRYGEAEQAARAALQQTPDSPEAHYWLARTLEAQGKAQEALPHYEITARQDIQFEAVALQLGRLYLRASEPARHAEGQRLIALYQEAEKNGRDYARARADLKAHPGDPDAHSRMARWYLRSGRTPQAIVELRRTLELRPKDREARRLLVTALKTLGRQSEAKQYAQATDLSVIEALP